VCIGRATESGDDLNAWDMLREVQTVLPGVPVLISTHEASPKVIVDLVKRGAFDYVLEPDSPRVPEAVERYVQELVLALSRAVEWRTVVQENERLKQDLVRKDFPDVVCGRSRAMMTAMELVHKVAPTSATVLVTGESGTGKELVARAIHALSDRESGPFVPLNCGSFSEHLIASELFGHEKGAFTGADKARQGLIREAAGGTLLLDEISTIPPSFQVMLLRVLEQRTARAVGGNEDYAVNCRFVAAANRDLEQMVREGVFREDLYYRLNVFNIHVPPLHKRREDIPLLTDLFIRQAAKAFGKHTHGITPGALTLLESAEWPGNVRQLRNAIERAVIVCENELIDTCDLDGRIRGLSVDAKHPYAPANYDEAMRTFERNLVQNALRRANRNHSEAARLLQIKRGRLNYRIQRLGINSR
ncbi:MAG: sigma-54 dependent transcriptional regulator, partial [Candidatus Pacebacteria bacterium]|nr:sigma-54 dependent transcriptional regulator [Candidatus Paceibacterota bacterium]